MKQLILCFSLLCLTSTIQAQDNNLKLTKHSFEKTYSQTPLVIDIKKARQSPIIELPKIPNIIWKYHPETVSYYNNHRSNSLCFNQSNGWEMIQVRPMKNQILYDAAAIGTGVVLGSILEALSNQ